jgi:cell division protein FtsI (penicillin-binding protein 3)
MPHQRRWTEFLNATISFGQGIGVTNLQMTTALSAIANGGNLMVPTLVRQITDSQGEVVQSFSPVVRRRVISARTARLVTDMMTAVTDEGGTGTGAAIDGYLVAGKTGTAQKSVGAKGYADRERFVASFFGFVPAEKPRLVISVVIDEPVINYYGGTVAAPLMGRIADRALRDMGVSPAVVVQRPAGKRPSSQTAKPENTTTAIERNEASIAEPGMMSAAELPMKEGQVRTPDLIGLNMKETLEILAGAGLRPYFMGTGVAVEQVPENGYPLDSGDYVQVNFDSPGKQ